MRFERASEFTYRRLFFGDMVLNWFLGAVLTFAPGLVDDLLGTAPLLPLPVYRIIGVGFLGFSAWQTWIIVRGTIGPRSWIFAAVMAEGPVILLTFVLLFIDLALYPGWRIVLWVGNVYMFFLGGWYSFLAWGLLKRGRDGSPGAV
jgi:hypothetical protein